MKKIVYIKKTDPDAPAKTISILPAGSLSANVKPYPWEKGGTYSPPANEARPVFIPITDEESPSAG